MKFTIAILVLLGLNACMGKPLSKNTRSSAALSSEDEDLSQSSGGLGFKEAFLTHVRPVLLDNCTGCHMHTTGAHPFAGASDDAAVEVAQRLIGSSLESSRFYLKIKNESHPTVALSPVVFPKIEAALNAFFAAIGQDDLNIAKGLLTSALPLSAAKEKLAEMSSIGVLVFEAEGASVAQDSKFLVKNGPYSNNLAVVSNVVPAHPVSQGSRFYSVEPCQAKPPVVQQQAHTGTPGNEGRLKYVYQVTASLRDPGSDGLFQHLGNDVKVPLLAMLPGNHDPRSMVPDNIYEASCVQSTPSKESITWRPVQLRTMLAQIEEYDAGLRKDRKPDGSYPNQRLHDFVARIVAASSGNPAEVLNYLDSFEMNCVSGPIGIEDFTFDRSAGRKVPALGSDGKALAKANLHANQTIPLAVFASKLTTPGRLEFKFKLPETFHLPDAAGGDSLGFKFLTKGQGDLGLRIRDSSDHYLNIDKNDCVKINNKEGWNAHPPVVELSRGQTYTIEVIQADEASVADSIMLISDTYTDEEADPDVNPTRLRHPIFGLRGTGSQEMIKYLDWPLVWGGTLRIDVDVFDKFYGLQAPMIILDEENKGKNISLKGFNFHINGNVSLTDVNFEVDAVRPPQSVLTFGRVMIPLAKGPAEDTLAVQFTRLDLTDTEGELAAYKDTPIVENQKCLAPEVFATTLWPLYTMQTVVRRDAYEQWANNKNYPVGGEGAQARAINPPEYYKCSGCHNAVHPSFQIPNNPEEACDKALARTNLANPLLSYALRGARGQFDHIPLYVAFDPFNGENFREKTLGNGAKLIYGPMLGRFEAYSEAEINALAEDFPGQANQIYGALTNPRRIGVVRDSLTGFPAEDQNGNALIENILPLDTRFGNNDFSTSFRRNDTPDISVQHNAVIDKYVKKFLIWVEEERKRQEKPK